MGRISHTTVLAPSRPRRSEVAAVFVLALALYINTVFGEFVFDDNEAIQQNIDVRMDTSLVQVFTNDFWGNPIWEPDSHKSYRPLTVLTFRWNRQLHGMHPEGFHVVNIMLHGVVCVLLLYVFTGGGASRMTAFLATLLFAAHPIHTEAVANVVGRAELLSAVAFLLSLLACQQSLQINSRWWSVVWLFLSTALGGVAMLCKEQGITCLGVNMILVAVKSSDGQLLRMFTDFVCRRRWAGSSIILIKGALIFLTIRILAIGGGSPRFVDSDNPASFDPHLLTRFLTYSFLCPFNFWLLLCPSQLCFDWSMGSIELVETITDLRNIVTAVFFISLISLGIFSVCLRLQTVILALTLILLPFLPATNLFFPVGFVVAERVLYIPSMGFCLMIAIGMTKLGHTISKKTHKDGRKLLGLATILLLFVFSVKTLARNRDWDNMHTLATSALSINPANAKVHFTIGNALAQQGNRSCEKYYLEALRLRVNYTLAWTNLGLVLLNTDRPKEAEQCYRTALKIKPDHVTANTNMGHLCRIQGRWKEAVEHYTTASHRRPNNPILHYHIGNALIQIGGNKNFEVAERELRTAVHLQPGYGEAHIALGKLLSRKLTTNNVHSTTARSEAIAHLQKGLLYVKTADQETYHTLGKLLEADNKHQLAAEATRRTHSPRTNPTFA